MKTSILTTVAAALIAGVAGLTLATTASAGGPKKLKLAGACIKKNGGTINKVSASAVTGWSVRLCVLHTISTQNPKIAFRGEGHASFNKFVGLPANGKNFGRCARSVVLVRLYRRIGGGKWKLVRKMKGNAQAKYIYGGKITSCQASAVTYYRSGGNQYRTLVIAIDGDGKNTGNLIRSVIGS
ncbi:MAG: hypothetical protein O7B98_15440 [Alphaproteobacteria bacterium]|nr:hypothetical protein [Alphaproteobacteria bacterium]